MSALKLQDLTCLWTSCSPTDQMFPKSLTSVFIRQKATVLTRSEPVWTADDYITCNHGNQKLSFLHGHIHMVKQTFKIKAEMEEITIEKVTPADQDVL